MDGSIRVNTLDVVGVGFGPANMSVAIALRESGLLGPAGLSCRFFDRQSEYRWHPGLLLPGSTMQISFLKDLATQRNPLSPYSFLQFLKTTGRLESFINLRKFHPSRIEFAAYLRWVADQFQDVTAFGAELVNVTAVATKSGQVDYLRLVAKRATSTETLLARNLVIATGGEALTIPGADRCDGRVAHCTQFLPALERHFPDTKAPYRFLVAGAGQSGIEMLLYLYRNYPEAQLTLVFPGFGLRQADSSSFINEVFRNDSVSVAYYGNNYVRKVMHERDTNYGVVDAAELDELYQIVHMDRFLQRERLKIKRFSRVVSVTFHANRPRVLIRDLSTESEYEEDCDGVFLGLGFSRQLAHPLIKTLAPYLRWSSGRPQIERSYQLKTSANFRPGIFVLGASEMEHGIGTTLLSPMAVRAGEVAEALRALVACQLEANTTDHAPSSATA